MTLEIHTYAVKAVTNQRRALFARTANFELLIQMLFHYRDEGRYLLHGFAVMPEHMHVLLTPHSGQTIERCVQCMKGGYSHAMRKQFAGEIWQPGYHSHRVRDVADFLNQLGYNGHNPEKRHLQDYPYVQTGYLDRMDAMPSWLAG
jgi:REP element-mobilizing transposase RayT